MLPSNDDFRSFTFHLQKHWSLQQKTSKPYFITQNNTLNLFFYYRRAILDIIKGIY